MLNKFMNLSSLVKDALFYPNLAKFRGVPLIVGVKYNILRVVLLKIFQISGGNLFFNLLSPKFEFLWF